MMIFRSKSYINTIGLKFKEVEGVDGIFTNNVSLAVVKFEVI